MEAGYTIKNTKLPAQGKWKHKTQFSRWECERQVERYHMVFQIPNYVATLWVYNIQQHTAYSILNMEVWETSTEVHYGIPNPELDSFKYKRQRAEGDQQAYASLISLPGLV